VFFITGRENRFRHEEQARKPDFLYVSGFVRHADLSPHERIALPLPLFYSFLVPARTAATPPSPACAPCPVAGATLNWEAESALDGAGPVRQASPSCPPAPARAGNRGRSRAVPSAAAREHCTPARTATARRAPDGPWRAPSVRGLS
jgi:hypothetical protein